MNVPIETKPALWGGVAGAVALMFVGFTAVARACATLLAPA